jgi:transmembrane sensor
MKKDLSNPNPDGIYEQASQFVSILDQRPLNAREKYDLKSWLDESELHRHAFKQTLATWKKLDQLQSLADVIPNKPNNNAKNRVLKFATAAGFVIFVGLATLSYFNSTHFNHVENKQTQFADVSTEIGGLKTINLVDGSTLTANTDSQLTISLTDKKRKVSLDKGEAYFDVAPDESRPFEVVVDNTIVRAVGTAFSVFKNNDTIKVVVTEGIVDIIEKNQTRTIEKAEPKARLKVGQQIKIHKEETTIETLPSPALATQHSWKQGMLIFNGEALEEVVAEFSRYNQIKMEFEDEKTKHIRVGGYFNSNDVAAMLSALNDNFGVEVTHLSSNHVRLKSKQQE